MVPYSASESQVHVQDNIYRALKFRQQPLFSCIGAPMRDQGQVIAVLDVSDKVYYKIVEA